MRSDCSVINGFGGRECVKASSEQPKQSFPALVVEMIRQSQTRSASSLTSA